MQSKKSFFYIILPLIFTIVVSCAEPIPDCNDVKYLAEYYAPHISFHSKEQYKPSSVEYYLDRVKMKNRGASSVIEENVTAENIDDIIYGPEKSWVEDPGDDENEFYLVDKGAIWDGLNWDFTNSPIFGDWNTAKVYVHTRDFGDNFLDIQYWFFYPYNGDLKGSLGSGGAHQGDWEHVTIRFRNCDPFAVYFAAHGSEGDWYSWANLNFSGQHPVIYSAKNSHAFYPKPGTYERRLCWKLFCDKFNDYTEDNTRYDTRHKLEFVEDETGTINHTLPDWLNYRGRWGRGDGKDTGKKPYGPIGPKRDSGWTKDPCYSCIGHSDEDDDGNGDDDDRYDGDADIST